MTTAAGGPQSIAKAGPQSQASLAQGPADRSGWSARLGAIPVLLAILAEAAWISIVAGLVQEFALRAPVVGIAGMAAFVGLGVLAARLLLPRTGPRWPLVALGFVVASALAGWLASPAARGALATGDVLGALGANPGGLAAGVAVLRGFPHGSHQLALDTVARMVFVAVPGLGLVAAAGGMVSEPWRGQFLADASLAAVIFAACGLLSLAFAGFAEIERSNLPTWRGNPAWVGLLLVAVAALVVTAMPISSMAGPAIALTVQVAIGILFVPLALAGLLAGSGAGLRKTLLFMAVAVAVIWVLSFTRATIPLGPFGGPPAAAPVTEASPADGVGLLGMGVVVLVLVAIGVILLARAWMRRPRDFTGDAGDERSFDLPEALDEPAGPRRRRRSIAAQPATAAEAYIHLMADLDDRGTVRREPSETPAEHARRLRESDEAGPSAAVPLALLAADYGLATFGDVRISSSETRRAIARWRALRRELGKRTATGSDGASAGPMDLG
jgi:hypothetical protein